MHDTLGVLLKYQDDIAKLQSGDVAKLLDELQARPPSSARRRAAGRCRMLAENIVHFARVLRSAGMPVGPDRVLAALEAVEAVGLERRDDVHAALSAVMLDRHEQQALFDAAFDAFWRDPKLLEQMMAAAAAEDQRARRQARARRAPTASPRRSRRAASPTPPEPANQTAKEEIEFDTSFTFSDRERLQRADFETMTAAEFELAKKLAEEVPLPVAAGAPAPPRVAQRARPHRPARDDAAHGAPAADAARRRFTPARAASCRRSSSCSTSPARWTATRGCCCTTCTA